MAIVKIKYPINKKSSITKRQKKVLLKDVSIFKILLSKLKRNKKNVS